MNKLSVSFTLLVLAIFFMGCTHKEEEKNQQLLEHLITTRVLRDQDHRRFVPPPPPMQRDSSWYQGKLQPDSILNSLGKLKILINQEVDYDPEKIKALPSRIKDFPKDFNFILEADKQASLLISLPQAYKDNLQWIAVKVIDEKVFNEQHDQMISDDNFGAYLTVSNFYIAPDRTKIFFTLDSYSHPLNGSGSAVFGTLLPDGSWKLDFRLLHIS